MHIDYGNLEKYDDCENLRDLLFYRDNFLMEICGKMGIPMN